MNPQFILISPYRSEEKHPANPVAIGQRFLNFGALSIVSTLSRSGWYSIAIDEYTLPSEQELVVSLSANYGDEPPLMVGVSTISAYSAGRTREVLQQLSHLWPQVPRLIGGQHFVGYWGHDFVDFMPEADILIAGEAEASIRELLATFKSGKCLETLSPNDVPNNVYWKANNTTFRGERPAATRLPMDELNLVDYSLYQGSERLFPSVEFSRGCPYSCVFCANGPNDRLGYRRASAASVGNALARLLRTRSERPVQFYMQASNFSVTCEEATTLANALMTKSDLANWRTEVRVDGLEEGALAVLASSGLRVLDLGLESASPQILKIMHKTANPDAYLEAAEKVLREATDAGIFTKVNFLIHPGDTSETVHESRAWLKSHSKIISGVSSGVAIEYPGTPIANAIGSYESQFGTRRLPHALSRWGVNYLQPSKDLSLPMAESLATEIAQTMQTRAAFAKSKSFGYLGVDTTPEAVLAAIPEASHATPYRD